MGKVCCIGLSLAARIIGTYGLSTTILLLNVFMSYFFSRKDDEDFFRAVESWALLGLNWVQVVRHSEIRSRVQVSIVCLLIYLIASLLANAYIAVGSIARKPKSAVPWMYLQMISIIDQSVALVVHLTHGPHYDIYDRSLWYIPASSVYLLLCVYFWMVVQAARLEWMSESPSSDGFTSTVVVPVATTPTPTPTTTMTTTTTTTPATTSTGQKTPSFLSQNLTMFASPRSAAELKLSV